MRELAVPLSYTRWVSMNHVQLWCIPAASGLYAPCISFWHSKEAHFLGMRFLSNGMSERRCSASQYL